MKNAGYIALSQHSTLLRQLDMIANNIANASTTAFKGERIAFTEYLARQPGGQAMSYVQDKDAKRDMRDGTLTPTGNSMDIAIRGAGYFVAAAADGQVYTRSGHLRVDAQQRLVTEGGLPIVGESGNEIRLDGDLSDLSIGRDGAIRLAGRQVDRLRLVQFDDEQALQKSGDGLYSTEAAPKPATEAEVRQGMIEESNVRPIVEMTTMLTIMRSYQTAQNFLDGEHQRQLKSIRELPRVDQA